MIFWELHCIHFGSFVLLKRTLIFSTAFRDSFLYHQVSMNISCLVWHLYEGLCILKDLFCVKSQLKIHCMIVGCGCPWLRLYYWHLIGQISELTSGYNQLVMENKQLEHYRHNGRHHHHEIRSINAPPSQPAPTQPNQDVIRKDK